MSPQDSKVLQWYLNFIIKRSLNFSYNKNMVYHNLSNISIKRLFNFCVFMNMNIIEITA